MDSSPLRIIAYRSSERALTKRKTLSLLSLLALVSTSLALAPPASAHLPVRLTPVAKKIESSPIILDGTVSFAVYADFSKPATRHIRFNHLEGDALEVQYLIPDVAMMRNMRKSKLPSIIITSPSGKKERLVVNERTRFSKPYLPQDYFYLARISRSAEAGTYSIAITSKRKASALVAIGAKEIPGDVLLFGSAQQQCPVADSGVTEDQENQEMEAIKQEVADQLIGMKEESAKLCADSNGWLYRVGERDGEFFALTRDYRTNRITVSITQGVITEVNVG